MRFRHLDEERRSASLSYRRTLESRLVASEHIELLEDLLSGSDLLFLSTLRRLLVMLSRTGFRDYEVPVALSFEFAVCIFESVSGRYYDSRHSTHPLPCPIFFRCVEIDNTARIIPDFFYISFKRSLYKRKVIGRDIRLQFRNEKNSNIIQR